jgi:hypothetical protein
VATTLNTVLKSSGSTDGVEGKRQDSISFTGESSKYRWRRYNERGGFGTKRKAEDEVEVPESEEDEESETGEDEGFVDR